MIIGVLRSSRPSSLAASQVCRLIAFLKPLHYLCISRSPGGGGGGSGKSIYPEDHWTYSKLLTVKNFDGAFVMPRSFSLIVSRYLPQTLSNPRSTQGEHFLFAGLLRRAEADEPSKRQHGIAWWWVLLSGPPTPIRPSLYDVRMLGYLRLRLHLSVCVFRHVSDFNVQVAFAGNPDVSFGDVNMAKEAVKGVHKPGDGGWPTMRCP